MQVPYTDDVTNEEVLEVLTKRKNSAWSTQASQTEVLRSHSMSRLSRKDAMLHARIQLGKRRSGCQRKQWLDDLMEWT